MNLLAILDLVDRHDLKNDTIVFYADDHGMARGKFTVYKSGLNVAFMVRWPGNIAPGRSNALISFADFLPTVLDLVNNKEVSPLPNFDGKAFCLFLMAVQLNTINMSTELLVAKVYRTVIYFLKGLFIMEGITTFIILIL